MVMVGLGQRAVDVDILVIGFREYIVQRSVGDIIIPSKKYYFVMDIVQCILNDYRLLRALSKYHLFQAVRDPVWQERSPLTLLLHRQGPIWFGRN